jgi:MFS family permease
MLGLFMVIPVLAIAAIEYPDYSPLLVGLAIGGYGLTQAILQIPMGILSDKWGRKPVIYLGLSFFALGSIIAATADTMTMLTVGRVLQGAGAIAGAVMALATDVTRESERAKVMAIIGVSIGFSFYLALLVGPMIAGTFGLSGIFWITAVLTICCIPLIKFGVATPAQQTPAGDTIPRRNQLKSLLIDSNLWRLNISVLIVHMLITCFFVQVPTLLSEADFGLNEHWKIYTPILLISVLLLVVLMKLGARVPTGIAFIFSLLLMSFGFGLFLLPSLDWKLITLAGILFFAGFNYMEAHMPALVSSIAPAGRKGSAMGIYASHQFFGAFLGGVLSGVLTQWMQADTAIYACLLVIFIGMILAAGIQSAKRVKRVTLKIPAGAAWTKEADYSNIQQALSSIEQVHDVSIDLVEQAIYLKVDSKGFDLEQAKALIQ